MSGVDENVMNNGDWSNPSPRSFFSSFLNETSFSDITENEIPLPGSEKHGIEQSHEQEMEFGDGDPMPGNRFSDSGPFSVQNSRSRGGLAERIASRAGFNDLRLNTARIRSDIPSPRITIPPGLSPTAFLDSPVFLSNSMVQPSPTTGKFFFPPSNTDTSVPLSVVPTKDEDRSFEDADAESFVFKPHVESNSSYFPNAMSKVNSAVDHQQSAPTIEVSVQPEHCIQTNNHESNGFLSQTQQGYYLETSFSRPAIPQQSDSIMVNENSPTPDDHPDEEGGDRRGDFPSVMIGAPSEDGYNWRKYGQKQVKGSEFPRSYYKCTHPNCQVKKKVERSHEGHITEIIYKGAHNHPKPPPNRRSGVGSCQSVSEVQFDGLNHNGSQDKSLWGNGLTEWKSDIGLDGASSMTSEYGVMANSMQTQDGSRFESPETVDVSSTLSNEEDEDDRGTLGSVSLGCDGDGDESESKRRKLEACAMDMSAASRAVREPRVVVQTTSEVDILDDGYRWRKYGQKVVKGNPNPRSYYKCTNPGCTVRKHVERASHDLKSVITTYEGKHNHDVPAARNSSHANSGSSGQVSTTHIHRRPDPTQVQDAIGTYDAQFRLPGRDPLGHMPPFSFGIGQQGLTNLSMPVMPVHPYLGPQRQMSEGGFMMPKGEPKEEPVMESGGLPVPNGASSVYHQVMNRHPL
ncbi:putative WRKY transcription factor 2 [Acorus gramineus]|uniref:WRKY transcription factor 2 n=1 Tax=Acorus gramineus TaxID=55184 RepID=A0AAV9BBK5_ACOGR|nr:putative WRKY transcription factor 2 [Acorus gramineus]